MLRVRVCVYMRVCVYTVHACALTCASACACMCMHVCVFAHLRVCDCVWFDNIKYVIDLYIRRNVCTYMIIMHLSSKFKKGVILRKDKTSIKAFLSVKSIDIF